MLPFETGLPPAGSPEQDTKLGAPHPVRADGIAHRKENDDADPIHPEDADRKHPEFAKAIGESLKFDTKTRSHMGWTTGEIREFLELFESLDPSRLLGYAVMNDLVEQIAERVISITTKDERTGFPVWFVHYLRKSEAEK